MKIYSVTGLIILISMVGGFSLREQPVEDIKFPEGYRKWTHIKTGFLLPEHPNVNYRGFNHVYANEKATRGYETGVFPDGAVIVFDVIEAVSKDNHIEEGKRNHIDVMERDSVKFAATGGWNYGQFEADKSLRILSAEVKTKCFNCHASQTDYVFTEFRQ